MPNTTVLNSPRPRNWNLAILASYLGGTPNELSQLKDALSNLLHTHGKLSQTFRSLAMRTELRKFIESNLHLLPPFVQDASLNPIRMDGLMGMTYKIKNEYHHNMREKRDSFADMSTAGDNSDGFDNNNDNDNEDLEQPTSSLPSQSQSQSQSQRPPPPIDVPNSSLNSSTQRDAPEPTNTTTNNNHNNNRTNGDNAAPPAEAEAVPAEPPRKRMRITPPIPNMLARNIWILNELDHTKNGLCSIQELVQDEDPHNPNLTPLITDLDYGHWISIVQAQCGYDFILHRLEYRPPADINITVQPGMSITIPIVTHSQWRGAINSQLQVSPDKDPVFYLVSLSESTQEPATPEPVTPPLPRNNPRNNPTQNQNQNHDDIVRVKQEHVESRMLGSGSRDSSV